MEDLHYKSIDEISKLLRSKEISSLEIVLYQLERIKKLDNYLNSYATLMSEEAINRAKKLDKEILQGKYRGPLHGVPIAVKDLCFTKGIRTMGGTSVYKNNIPDYNATIIESFYKAGAVILGKLNLTEGAISYYNPEFQIPQNPWKEGHWSGASSSGSGVATASGLAFGTIGTDTGGSIRHPSAVCGNVGIKPTWGRVSRYGVMDLAPSLDHVGPMTRTTKDAAIMLQVISGYDPKDKTSLYSKVPDMLSESEYDIHGMKIGYDEKYTFEDMETEFAESVHSGIKILEQNGAEIVNINMPKNLREYVETWSVICSSEAAAVHSKTFPSRSKEYGPFFRNWLENGINHTAKEYSEANFLRNKCTGEINYLMKDVDVIACPSTARSAYPVTPAELYSSPKRDPWLGRFTVPTDYAGLPTISLPSGINKKGLPLSIQFIGHFLAEPTLIRIGSAYERFTNFTNLHPPL